MPSLDKALQAHPITPSQNEDDATRTRAAVVGINGSRADKIRTGKPALKASSGSLSLILDIDDFKG